MSFLDLGIIVPLYYIDLVGALDGVLNFVQGLEQASTKSLCTMPS